MQKTTWIEGKPLSTAEVMAYLGCSRVTLWSWRKAGKAPPYFRVGSPTRGRCLHPRPQFLEWLAQRCRETEEATS